MATVAAQATAVVAKDSVPTAVVMVAATAVAVTVVVPRATTIATVNSNRLAHKTRGLHRVKAAAVVQAARAWANPPVLPTSPVLPVHQQANPIQCAPAWI